MLLSGMLTKLLYSPSDFNDLILERLKLYSVVW
jgi:hypothetical protein